MAKRNKWIQIMAFLALFWIIIWIIWTWLLIIFGNSNSSNEQSLTPEQYIELQKMIEAQSWVTIESDTNTLTWETN